ncbi:hypothetical protein HY637_00270 [Candidatus Woesearchaeota archaeon]|nr:hypothetical protein [Candidatus Woesearchaeota archaeon]
MKEKKQKKRWGLMFFIVIIMIGTSFSVFLYGGSPAKEVVRYNGIKFVGNGQMWFAKINDKKAAFSFLPIEVEDIAAGGNIAGLLQNKIEIDITSDFNSTFNESIALAQHQMGLTLNEYGIYARQGFTRNNTYNFPIITCKDSTTSIPVVYFKQGNSTAVYSDGNCVIAESPSGQDFIRVKDRLLYMLFGVMK